MDIISSIASVFAALSLSSNLYRIELVRFLNYTRLITILASFPWNET